MKRDDKLTDAQLIVQQRDRQKHKIWKFTGVNPLALLLLVSGLVSCAAPKPAPTPSVEVTPIATPTPTVKPSPTPTPKPSAAADPRPEIDAPQSEIDAPQSAGSTDYRDQTSDEYIEPEYTPKEKAIEPERPQRAVSKPAPPIEPDIAPQPRAEDPAPPAQAPPIQMAPIVPEQDSDPEPPPSTR